MSWKEFFIPSKIKLVILVVLVLMLMWIGNSSNYFIASRPMSLVYSNIDHIKIGISAILTIPAIYFWSGVSSVIELLFIRNGRVTDLINAITFFPSVAIWLYLLSCFLALGMKKFFEKRKSDMKV